MSEKEWTATDAAGIPRDVVAFVDGKPVYNAAEDRTCPECGLSFVKLRARLAEVEAENERLRAYLSDYTAKLHRVGAWDR